jgi:hypothetical protein
MIRFEPDWVGELLGMWASKDRADVRHTLGYPDVSPMFARVVGVSFETEDSTGYSSAEMRAMTAAIEWLQLNHPEHWRALSREVRFWSRKDLQATDQDERLAIEAGQFLANYIDKTLG